MAQLGDKSYWTVGIAGLACLFWALSQVEANPKPDIIERFALSTLSARFQDADYVRFDSDSIIYTGYKGRHVVSGRVVTIKTGSNDRQRTPQTKFSRLNFVVVVQADCESILKDCFEITETKITGRATIQPVL